MGKTGTKILFKKMETTFFKNRDNFSMRWFLKNIAKIPSPAPISTAWLLFNKVGKDQEHSGATEAEETILVPWLCIMGRRKSPASKPATV